MQLKGFVGTVENMSKSFWRIKVNKTQRKTQINVIWLNTLFCKLMASTTSPMDNDLKQSCVFVVKWGLVQSRLYAQSQSNK